MKLSDKLRRQALKFRNESVKINFCDIFKNGKKIGKGFTITRSNGSVIGNWFDDNGYELPPGDYDIRHNDIERIANACWIKQ